MSRHAIPLAIIALSAYPAMAVPREPETARIVRAEGGTMGTGIQLDLALPAPPSSSLRAIRAGDADVRAALARPVATPGSADGVARALPAGAPWRGYRREDFVVRTGIGFAPGALVSCFVGDRGCDARVPLDGGILLSLERLAVDPSDLPAMRAGVVEAIRSALPDGPPAR